jgi:MFS family permease
LLRGLADGFREVRSILRGNVGIMALSWFLFGLSGALVFPFFTIYAKDLGADDLSIALIRSMGMYALAFSIILGGFLTDYIGRVKTIVIGTSFIVITQYGYAFVQSWTQLAILWVIDEAAHFYQPALSAIIMDSLPRDKTLRGFLVLQAFPSIPWLFMPIIGGYLYDSLGLTGIRIGFLVSGTISVAVLVLRVKGLEETIDTRRAESIGVLLREIKRYRDALKNALKVYVFTGFLAPLATSVEQTYGAIYVVKELGASNTDWGLYSSLSTIVSITSASILAMRRNIRESIVILV